MSSPNKDAIVSWTASSNPDFHGYLILTSVQKEYDVHATFLVSGKAPHISVRPCSGTSDANPELNSKDKLEQVDLTLMWGAASLSMTASAKVLPYCGDYLTSFVSKISQKQKELNPTVSKATTPAKVPLKTNALEGTSAGWAGAKSNFSPTLQEAKDMNWGKK